MLKAVRRNEEETVQTVEAIRRVISVGTFARGSYSTTTSLMYQCTIQRSRKRSTAPTPKTPRIRYIKVKLKEPQYWPDIASGIVEGGKKKYSTGLEQVRFPIAW
jgi:hypothetical protein